MNKEILIKDIKEHDGEIVLFMDTCYCLLGFLEDQHNYYYIARNLYGNIEYLPGELSFICLKNLIAAKDYARLEDIFRINYSSFNKNRRADIPPLLNIMVDVDGTLYQTLQKPNPIMIRLVKILRYNTSCRIYAWSGGGAKYARQVIVKDLKLPEDLFDGYYSKLEKLPFEPDLTIDDEDYTAVGKINLKIIKAIEEVYETNPHS